LFKTIYGGKTWKLVLHAPSPNDARVGCGDVVLDPANPEIVYATLYARQRTPWSFAYGITATNGADVGGTFKSADGGATWKKCAGGLPGQTGRIGLAVSASKPKIVMAVVQSDEGGATDISTIHSRAFSSEDGGKMDADERHQSAPVYFSQFESSGDDQRLYVLGMAVLVSMAGKNWKISPVHGLSCPCHSTGKRPTPSPVKPETKTSLPSRRFADGCSSGPTEAFIKVSLGQKLNILTVFPRASFIGSRWTIRGRITALRAGCRTMKVLPDRARCQ
jgi:hypothetical protein